MATAIITANQINCEFSKMVSDMLTRGYTIHSASMAGHQGEINKVDVANGKSVWRVLLKKNSCIGETSEDGWSFYGDKIVLEVRLYEGAASKNQLNGRDVIWNDDGRVIFDKTWYSVGSHDKAYLETIEAALDCQDKSFERWRQKDSDQENALNMTTARRKAIADMVSKRKGYSRISKKHIDKVTCRVDRFSGKKHYIVSFINSTGKGNLVLK